MDNELLPRTKQTGSRNYFGGKTKKVSHPALHFTKNIVSQIQYKKNVGIVLDAR